MTINIKATNTTLTDAIRNVIDDKLAHLSKFLREEDYVHVELAVDKKHKSGMNYLAEISVDQTKFYAQARANDFYEALDLVIPKIKEQLVKNKDRQISRRRDAARKAKGMK